MSGEPQRSGDSSLAARARALTLSSRSSVRLLSASAVFCTSSALVLRWACCSACSISCPKEGASGVPQPQRASHISGATYCKAGQAQPPQALPPRSLSVPTRDRRAAPHCDPKCKLRLREAKTGGSCPQGMQPFGVAPRPPRSANAGRGASPTLARQERRSGHTPLPAGAWRRWPPSLRTRAPGSWR